MAGAPVPPPLAHSVANLPRPPQANKETVQLPRMMQPTVALAALAGAAALLAAPARAAGTVNTYSIDDPEYGSCRLKGVDESSDNFKYYASVSGEDETLNSACARCIKVTEGDASVTAYVLDVCDGCASGEVQLSSDALSELGLNSSTVGSASVSWDFVTCPSNMLSGNVKACLMEGASYSYIPLEFYNSYKVISAVTIDGVNATSTTDSYLWYANSGNASTTWYKSIDVEMTSTDGETKSTTFAFTSTSGCATSDVQFSVASTADGVDGSTGGGTSSSSSISAGLIGGIVGAVVVVLLIIASVIVYKRRRRSSNDTDTPNDVEGQYLSPKKRAATGTAANEGDQSHHDHDGSVVEPRSPTMEYAESYTPAAGAGLHQPTDLDLDVDSHPVETESAAAVAAAATGATLSHGSSTSSMASVQGARPSSHLSFGTNSPASPAASHASSAVESEHLSSRSGPRALSAEPTFRFSSKNMYSNAAVPNPQKVAQSQKAAPTLTAPVIPASMTANLQYDDDDDRGSFDVDDMRGTEEMKTNEPLEPSYDERSSRAYGAPAAYYAPESAVTSPQSYVRATSLRRNPSQRTANPTRSSSRFNNNSTMFSDASQPSTYAAPAQQQQPASSYAYSSQPHSEAASSGYDPYGSQPGSFRESTGGYSRESLNILGYPYSKRSQRHMNN